MNGLHQRPSIHYSACLKGLTMLIMMPYGSDDLRDFWVTFCLFRFFILTKRFVDIIVTSFHILYRLRLKLQLLHGGPSIVEHYAFFPSSCLLNWRSVLVHWDHYGYPVLYTCIAVISCDNFVELFV